MIIPIPENDPRMWWLVVGAVVVFAGVIMLIARRARWL
jgi:hypothetical protein